MKRLLVGLGLCLALAACENAQEVDWKHGYVTVLERRYENKVLLPDVEGQTYPRYRPEKYSLYIKDAHGGKRWIVVPPEVYNRCEVGWGCRP